MNIDDLINAAKGQQTAVAHRNKYDANLQSLPINDKIHLYNHLNYLFRTDAGQKWTNELTDGNAYILWLPSHEKFGFRCVSSFEERKELKDAILQRVKNLAEARGKKFDRFVKKLQQTRVDYLDGSVYYITDAVKKDSVQLLTEIEDGNPGFNLICSVIHTDQKDNYVHIHLLYLMD